MYDCINHTPQRLHALSAILVAGMALWTNSFAWSRTPAARIDPTGEPFALDFEAEAVADVYPFLATEGLIEARLMDLPQGVLLRATSLAIRSTDLETELANSPAPLREELRAQLFYLLEQIATRKLLAAEAVAAGVEGHDDDARIQAHLERIAEDVVVSDAEVEAFYAENRGMLGGAGLENVDGMIRRQLLERKKQEQVTAHVALLGRRQPLAVDADWTAQQAALSQANPLDRARASGKPTLVSFGSKGCGPCAMMEPIRATLQQEFEGQLNVVFVDVNQHRILALRYGVRDIPYLVFFDMHGYPVHSHHGFMHRFQIIEWLRQAGVIDT